MIEKLGNWRPIGVVLHSADRDYDRQAQLSFYAFGRVLRIPMPNWLLRPYLEHRKSFFPGGGEWVEPHQRCVGWRLHDGYLQVMYGAQTHDSDTCRSWGYFLPWMQWRHVRCSIYGADRTEWWREYPNSPGLTRREALKKIPPRRFLFSDFDGAQVIATTHITEDEWVRGTRWWKWVGLFCAPRVHRALNIEFNCEVGRRKGSWKGGVMAHGIELAYSLESHRSAFLRYCEKNGLLYIKEVIDGNVKID